MDRRRPRPQSEFEERVIQIDRVARVVKGGRRFRFRASVVIGDRRGRVGLGVAKASEVQGAIQKAVAEAKKEMVTVQKVADTIPFALTTKFAGAKLLLKPARPGTGIIAGGAVRPIMELGGITNVLSKSLGSDNRINNAKAAMVALRVIAGTDLSKITERAKRVTERASAKDGEEKAQAAPEKSTKRSPAKRTSASAKPAAKTAAKSKEKKPTPVAKQKAS